jgi:hypothetical protein
MKSNKINKKLETFFSSSFPSALDKELIPKFYGTERFMVATHRRLTGYEGLPSEVFIAITEPDDETKSKYSASSIHIWFGVEDGGYCFWGLYDSLLQMSVDWEINQTYKYRRVLIEKVGCF